MKPIGITLILLFHLILCMALFLGFVLSDAAEKSYIDMVIVFISIIIMVGIFEKNNSIRKFTVIYYFLGAAIKAVQLFIGAPYVLLYTENSLNYEGVSTAAIALIISISIIVYLSKKDVKVLFQPNNASKPTPKSGAV